MDDWRINGQEKYLSGKHVSLKKWVSNNSNWDHDHCEFCMIKISSSVEDVNEAYVTDDNKHWICKQCFNDFSYLFR